MRISALLLSLVFPLACLAFPLATDSTLFARYYAFVESGDTLSAFDLLFKDIQPGDQSTEQKANFFLAHLALAAENFEAVPAMLDLGIPPELTDYSLWIRADALSQAGQPALALPYWSELAGDTESVLAEAAHHALVLHFRRANLLDSVLVLAEFHQRCWPHGEYLNEVLLAQAEALTDLGRHTEATDLLWRIASSDPGGDFGKRASDILTGYVRSFAHRPRGQTTEEMQQELSAYENRRAYAAGLNRVEELLRQRDATLPQDLLSYFKGRFEGALSRHRQAMATLSTFDVTFPESPWRWKAALTLGRSAYLIDEDSLALAAFDKVTSSCSDTSIATKAWELQGVLHLDRHRPLKAVEAYQQWCRLSAGSDDADDCLWRLGWAQFEAAQYDDAAESWGRLLTSTLDVDYQATALYWRGRAEQMCGLPQAAGESLEQVRRRFPYSYYAVIQPVSTTGNRPAEFPLRVPTLDEIWQSGGPHARKFALLTAMRRTEFAMGEWEAARDELRAGRDFGWWKAQLFLWENNPMLAWRIVRSELGEYIRTAGSRPGNFASLVWPLDFDPVIVQTARTQRVDPYLVFGLICQESHFRPDAVSSAGAFGLMQLMPETARQEARQLGISYSREKLLDPEYNIALGIPHLAGLFEEFNRDSILVLAAYNAGKSAAQSWLEEFGDCKTDVFVERIPYRETRLFIKRIIENAAAYRRLYPDVLTFPSPGRIPPTAHE